MIERLQVQIPAEAMGGCSPDLTFCSDSYLVLPHWHVKYPDCLNTNFTFI